MRRLSAPLILILALLSVMAAGMLTLFLADRDAFFALLPRTVHIVAGSIVACLFLFGLWSETHFGRAVRNALSWAIIGGAIFAAYSYRDRLEWAGLRLFPDHAQPIAMVEREGGGEKVVIERRRGGQFRAPAAINGAAAIMLVDTGASIVTLTQADARAAGIETDRLDYSASIFTANGKTTAAPVIIDRIAIGTLERRRIPALVARSGTLERSLLGLSFLDTLSSYSVSGDRLELTP